MSNTATSVSGLTWGGRGGGAWSVFATNCVFTGNVAQYPNATGTDPRGGGGLAESRAFDCDIVGNQTTQKAGGGGNVSGGGVDGGYCENCRILNNSSWSYGGGCIYNTNVNCVVAGNSATIGGGGLHCEFRDCIISNNVARDVEGGATYGGATYNCTVMFNKAKSGAALFKGFHQGNIVASNVVTTATTRGSGISSSSTTPDATAVNCTVVGNTGGECQVYAMYVTNMIVVGTATDVKSCTAVNSLIGTRSGGTVEACLEGVDPKFVTEPREGARAYSLRRCSPCRDKGLHLPWMAAATDLLGNPRVKFGTVDLGALECLEVGGTMVVVN